MTKSGVKGKVTNRQSWQ